MCVRYDTPDDDGGHYNFDGNPNEEQGLGAKIASYQKIDIHYRRKGTLGKEKER